MADALLQGSVRSVETGAQFGRPAQVGARGEDAEAATDPRHTGGIRPVRRLAGLADDAKHVRSLQSVNREPVEPRPARLAVAGVALPRRQLRSGQTLRSAHSHRADNESVEPGMGLQVAAQLALNGAAFRIACAKPHRTAGKPAPFFDAFEQGFPGGGPGEEERYAVQDRALDMLDRARPFDHAERRVDDEKLVAGDDVGEQDRHRLAVLASAVVESDESAAGDMFPAFGRDGELGLTAERRGGAHAARPSWSVIDTKSGGISNLGSPPSSADGHALTATMAAAGVLPTKHQKSAKSSCCPGTPAPPASRGAGIAGDRSCSCRWRRIRGPGRGRSRGGGFRVWLASGRAS